MKKVPKSKDREKMSPPLDIYWIWHVHMLNPTQYAGNKIYWIYLNFKLDINFSWPSDIDLHVKHARIIIALLFIFVSYSIFLQFVSLQLNFHMLSNLCGLYSNLRILEEVTYFNDLAKLYPVKHA